MAIRRLFVKTLLYVAACANTSLCVADDTNTHFIWNFAIASSCDVNPVKGDYNRSNAGWPYGDMEKYRSVKAGDIVWLQTRHFRAFQQLALPYISEPFVIVLNEGDEFFPYDIYSPQEIDALLSDPRIIAIFAQNCNYRGSSTKMHHLPIGFDFHTIAYKQGYWGEPMQSPAKQEEVLMDIMHRLKPTNQRIKRAFVDFQHFDTMNWRYASGQYSENRTQIFERLKKTGFIEYSSQPITRTQLWQTKGAYAFSVSPHGNGLDCHRTWEDLALGCIVIVKTSPLDPMYEGLPVVIVNDWSEITPRNISRWIKQYGDAFTNPSYREKLTNAYWWNKIQAAAAPYKKR